MSKLSVQSRMIGSIVLIGVAVIAVLWFIVIGPQRADRGGVVANVAAQQQRVDDARKLVADYRAARKQFPGMLSELKRLDIAVPSRAAISQLLRQLQGRAHARHSSMQLAALKTVAAAPGTTAAAPGATTGPGGLAALPFTFEYTGGYFDLVSILRAVRASVQARSGDLKIDGRLLTIDGLTFKRPTGSGKLTQAIVSATAYIAPDAAAPQIPAASTATTPQGGS
jgi:Tfp pilus assembly protein PilO